MPHIMACKFIQIYKCFFKKNKFSEKIFIFRKKCVTLHNKQMYNMKKIGLSIVIIILISTLYTLHSCREDETIKAIVTVKLMQDTNVVVPYARVRMEKFDVRVEGVCNEKGQFEHIFRDEAILDVRAWEVDSLGNETRYGTTTIRLKKGHVARKTVLIN